ncbi:MAG: c-type cytochrome, partial [Nannocystaceae bacterium]
MTIRLVPLSTVVLLSTALTSGCTPGAGESSPTGSTGETDSAGTESDTGSETDTESDTGVDPNVPTYFGDVLPIFAEACENCHADGGIAPFVTNRYEDVVPWGPAIAAAVTARTMPPFLVDNSGTCETFEHARWLSDDEIATIEAWVDADMPEGTLVGEAPSPPPPNELVGEEIVKVSTPAYTPVAKGTSDALYDDYRCFAVEIGNTETKFLQGFEIEPGNAEIVHHVVGFKVDPNRKVIGDITNAGIMELLDGKDDEPGWE